jgi:hypothetical protein
MTGLINLIFFLVVAVTLVGSVWLSRKYKERYAEFPWWKAGLLIAIEVAAWVIFIWLSRHPLIFAGAVVIMVIILLLRRKKQEQVL